MYLSAELTGHSNHRAQRDLPRRSADVAHTAFLLEICGKICGGGPDDDRAQTSAGPRTRCAPPQLSKHEPNRAMMHRHCVSAYA